MTVKAASTETYFAVAADVAVSTSGTAFDGSVIVLVVNAQGGTGTFAYIGSGTTLVAQGDVSVIASDTFSTLSNGTVPGIVAGNLQFGSSSGIGVATVIIDRQGTVDAAIKGGDITSRGSTGLTVSATQEDDMLILAVAGSGGETAGVAGSVIVDVLGDKTMAHIDNGTRVNCAVADSCANGGTPSGTQGVAVSAMDTTHITSAAGQLTVGGTAGVGAGVDVEVVSKDTEASIGNAGMMQAKGNVTVDATSSENVLSISVGGGFAGTVAVNVNVGVPVYSVTTRAFIADGTSPSDGAQVFAGGSVRVAADETLSLNSIAGNISASGTAAVGAAVAVPVVTKNTDAYIGNYAQVNGSGGLTLPVKTGQYSVTTQDTRFDPTASGVISGGDTINLGFDHNFKDGQEIRYDNGGGSSISGLTDGNLYYVKVVGPEAVKLYSSPDLSGSPIGLSGGSGQNHRLVPTNQAAVQKDESVRFDPTAANAVDLAGPSNDCSTFPECTIQPAIHPWRGQRRCGRLQRGRRRRDRRPRRWRHVLLQGCRRRPLLPVEQALDAGRRDHPAHVYRQRPVAEHRSEQRGAVG